MIRLEEVPDQGQVFLRWLGQPSASEAEMSVPLRVLMVEDSPEDAFLILRALRQAGYEPVSRRVENHAAMQAALEQAEWDVILSDYSLPQFSGLLALELYREQGLDIPFIIVSGAIGEETAVKMMTAGAHDYLMKDRLARLGPAIERGLREAQERRERRQAEKALRESEQRLRSLAEATFEGIVITEQGTILDVNVQAAAMLGYKPAELVGRAVLEMVAPESREVVQAAIRSGQQEPYEHLALRKDGTQFPVEIRARIVTLGGRQLRMTIIRDITEHKQAEQAFQAILKGTARAVGHAFFESFVLELAAALHVRYAYIGQFVTGGSPRLRTIAQAAGGVIIANVEYDLDGTPCQDVVSHSLAFYPRDVQRLFPRDARLARIGAVSYLGVRLFAASGKPLGIVGVADDRPMPDTQFAKDLLTIFAARAAAELERVEAEAALREGEAKYRLIADNMSDTVWLADLDLQLTYISPSVERATGYTLDELRTMTLDQLLTPNSLRRARSIYNDTLTPGALARLDPSITPTLELEFRRRDGSTYWSEVTVTLLRDDVGQPKTLMGVGRGIDERKRAEAERAQYTAELAALYRASALLMNPGGDLAGLAEQIARTLTQEFAFADCGVLLLDEAGTELTRVVRAGRFDIRPTARLPLTGPGLTVTAVHTGQTVYAPEVAADPRYVPNNPTTRSELVVPLRVPGSGDRVIGVLDLQSPEPDAFDERARRIVTAYAERAALALENARLVASLEQAVQRANQLAVAAEESSRLKSEFLANTSHELRTPLTAILGSLGLVLDSQYDSPEEARNFVQIAAESARNLLSIVNDLLDTAKIEAGRLELELQPLDLAPVLRHVLTVFHGQAEVKALRMELTMPQPSPFVLADPDMVQRILTNLIGNAVKFTERGSVTVVAQEDLTRNRLLIQVQDTGIGIAPHKQATLFQPFVQADGSTTRRYGGTGLGLSISRRLAEMMDGSLELYSAGEGQGSTFTLILPLADAASSS